MKTNLFIILIVCLSLGQKTFAQENNELNNCHSLEDTLQYLKKEFVESNRFIGKPAEELFQICKTISPLNAIEFGTSPYVDPDGESYLKGVKIRLTTRWSKASRYIVMDVFFEDTHVNIVDFRKNVPVDKIIENTGHFIIKKLDIYIYQI